ncbi:hypothetical protein GCM10010521_67510 [Streptomyces rameus]|uniref:Uncharacterized protein n=1 Tax=Streptomyces rameus TaxID=68261 RepID=A0ABN3V5K9_9ACTN
MRETGIRSVGELRLLDDDAVLSLEVGDDSVVRSRDEHPSELRLELGLMTGAQVAAADDAYVLVTPQTCDVVV